MPSTDRSPVDNAFLANAMASFLQIAAVVGLAYVCFKILSPFLSIVVWGIIIAVAVYPGHLSLTTRLGGRAKMSATLIAVIGIAVIVVPVLLVGGSVIDSLKQISESWADGTMTVAAPNESVAEWPLIGTRVYDTWSEAATNLEATVNQFEPQIRAAGQKTFGFATHTVLSVFQFIFSVIIAAALLNVAAGGRSVTRSLLTNLIGPERGESMTELSIKTIRSVVKGVLGVAVIQAVAAAVILVVAGIPGAGIWAGIVLVLAIVQLPPILVLGPIAFWYFSVAEPTAATLFLVAAIVVSISDTFLKPMLLGRGVQVPMLVILLGAIGGALAMGIVGLFVGSVVLALGYEILTAWMAADDNDATSGETAA